MRLIALGPANCTTPALDVDVRTWAPGRSHAWTTGPVGVAELPDGRYRGACWLTGEWAVGLCKPTHKPTFSA